MRVKVRTVVLGCSAYVGSLGALYWYFQDLGEKERQKEAARLGSSEAGQGSPRVPGVAIQDRRPLSETER